jgi:hypothetical protein
VKVTVSESKYSSVTWGVGAASVWAQAKLPIEAAPPLLALPVSVTWDSERTVAATGSRPGPDVGLVPMRFATAWGGSAELL